MSSLGEDTMKRAPPDLHKTPPRLTDSNQFCCLFDYDHGPLNDSSQSLKIVVVPLNIEKPWWQEVTTSENTEFSVSPELSTS